MNHAAAGYEVSMDHYDDVTRICHPRMFQSGVQSEFAWIPAKDMRE
jgi:hypothetical protein